MTPTPSHPEEEKGMIRDHEYDGGCLYWPSHEDVPCGAPESRHAKAEPKLEVDAEMLAHFSALPNTPGHVEAVPLVESLRGRAVGMAGQNTVAVYPPAGDAAPVSAEAREETRRLIDWMAVLLFAHWDDPVRNVLLEKIAGTLTSYAESRVKEALKWKGIETETRRNMAGLVSKAREERDAAELAAARPRATLAQENADLREQVARLGQKLHDHHAAHVMRFTDPGNTCPVCVPPVPLRWPDLAPISEPIANIVQRMANALSKAEAERDIALKSLAEQRALVDKLVEALREITEEDGPGLDGSPGGPCDRIARAALAAAAEVLGGGK